MAVLASAVFYLGLTGITLVVGSLSPLAYLLPSRAGYWLMTRWNVSVLWWLKRCCRIDYTIQGRENLPASGPYVVMANHQSAFETILIAVLFPQPAFVLKRALLRIPFFGWGMAATRPIAIDRESPVRSLRHLTQQAQERLEKGDVVAIFPEGSRMPIGSRRPYRAGGAHIATRCGVGVIPMVHNAGHFWPPGFLKRPGHIEVRVGPLIEASGLTAEELNTRVRAWIESNGAGLSPPV